MSTVGHFVTMIGVLSFYLMILDSHLEKKLQTYIHTLTPRFNKRCLYYLGKLIHLNSIKKMYINVPTRRVQQYLLKN
ncbi:MAG: hypothetical protein KDH96_06425 [Candidatus Riesia sp.]|nr:hypothetical protein [Candidatus Riesia sp.]